MSMTDNQRFNIYFGGECLSGFDEATVRPALAKLFKADESTLNRLFSGQRQRIKRDCDESTALRYQKAMAAAGARALIVPAEAADGTAPATTTETPAPPASGGPASAPSAPAAQQPSPEPPGLSLAPAGSDVLRADERRETPPAHIDLDHLSLAAVGERLGSAVPEPAAPVAAPDLQVAAVGERLSEQRDDGGAAAPDTSSISLAEGDFDLSDCAPAPAAAPVTGDGFSLAESGSDLLSPDERRETGGQAPDTSHIRLDDPDES